MRAGQLRAEEESASTPRVVIVMGGHTPGAPARAGPQAGARRGLRQSGARSAAALDLSTAQFGSGVGLTNVHVHDLRHAGNAMVPTWARRWPRRSCESHGVGAGCSANVKTRPVLRRPLPRRTPRRGYARARTWVGPRTCLGEFRTCRSSRPTTPARQDYAAPDGRVARSLDYLVHAAIGASGYHRSTRPRADAATS